MFLQEEKEESIFDIFGKYPVSSMFFVRHPNQIRYLRSNDYVRT